MRRICIGRKDSSLSSERMGNICCLDKPKEGILTEEARMCFVMDPSYSLDTNRYPPDPATGSPFCMICKREVFEEHITLVECMECTKFIGHTICIKRNNGCPVCIKRIPLR